MREPWISGCRFLVAALLAGAIAGCGGGLEEARSEPSSREGDELRAREWHDRVVRLESEAIIAAQQEEECGPRCGLAARTCELAEQICDVSEADDNDEGTRVLCEDARPRCQRANAAASSCACEAGA